MMQDRFHQIGGIHRIRLSLNAFAGIRPFPADPGGRAAHPSPRPRPVLPAAVIPRRRRNPRTGMRKRLIPPFSSPGDRAGGVR